jgi:hypothetical protein
VYLVLCSAFLHILPGILSGTTAFSTISYRDGRVHILDIKGTV